MSTRRRGRSRHRADRSQRRRQDDAVQRHHRAARRRTRAGSCSTARHHRRKPAPAGPARDRPHVPAARDVRHARPRARTSSWRRRCGGAGRTTQRSPATVTDEILERVGLQDVAEERVDRLPTGTARLVELARALATQPRVLLLDEPSAGLNEAETATLGRAAARARRLTASAVLLVEHDMAFVMGTCERIHVLDFGRDHRGRDARRRCRPTPTVRAAYLGRRRRRARTALRRPGRPRLRADGDARRARRPAAPALELRDVRPATAPSTCCTA